MTEPQAVFIRPRREIPWWPIVGLIVGLAVVFALDRWSGRTDRWEQRLDSAVVATKAAIRTDSIALAAKLEADSIRTVEALAKADSAEMDRNRIAQDNGRLRVQLREARTMPDTVRVQASIIAKQDSMLASDSVQKTALRATIASQNGTIIDVREGLRVANQRIADLLGVAGNRPKELKLLGFSLSLKPYIGVGANVSPAGKVTTGLQLGVSILRG